MDLKKLYKPFQLLVANFVSILFLMGLIIINVAVYIGTNLVAGLITTGATLIVIALIIDYESRERR